MERRSKRDVASERKAVTFNDPNEANEKCLVVVTWKVRLLLASRSRRQTENLFSFQSPARSAIHLIH